MKKSVKIVTAAVLGIAVIVGAGAVFTLNNKQPAARTEVAETPAAETPAAVTAVVTETPEIKNYTSADAKKAEESEASEPENIKALHNPMYSRIYPGMESENENTGNDESIGELTEETKEVLIESLTDSYGEKMVEAFREQFGDERAISMLSMRDAVSYSRVHTGMESN